MKAEDGFFKQVMSVLGLPASKTNFHLLHFSVVKEKKIDCFVMRLKSFVHVLGIHLYRINKFCQLKEIVTA